MRLTQEVLRDCYAILCRLPPFHRWSLPKPTEISFVVMRNPKFFGEYIHDHGAPHVHTIRVSEKRHSRLETLFATMAHEMCHVRLETSGCKERSEHGPEFKRLARLCCKHHPMFDPVCF